MPSYLVYGYGENTRIITSKYVPIWKLIDKTTIVNDSFARYEVNIARMIYTIVILSAVVVALYFALRNNRNVNKSVQE